MLTLLVAAMPALLSSNAPSIPATIASWIDDEFEQRLKAAGTNVDELWRLYLWCASTDRAKDGGTVLRRIIREAPEHKEAREKLGHVQYQGQWFTSAEKLAAFQQAEAARLSKEKGWVEWKGTWVDPRDLPYLRRGLVRDPWGGLWVRETDLARRQAGWLQQDDEWVPPEDAVYLEEGLFRCAGKWLTLEAANRHHAELGTAWRIPGDGYVLWTTLERDVALQAIAELNRAVVDVQRILGRLPPERVTVVLLRDLAQYDSFCNGELGSLPDTRRHSRFRDAFLTDSWTDRDTGELLVVGAGFWDASSEAGRKLGSHAARLALGLSCVEALDPSPRAREALAGGALVDEAFLEKYSSEKALPAWFRWGAATYLERYFFDQTVPLDGNPHWARDWSIGNIRRFRGLDPLAEIFALRLGVQTKEDTDRAAKLLNEAGLLVAFVLDGGVAAVEESHAELKAALIGGTDPRPASASLEAAIVAHEPELRAFSGL